MRAAGAKAFCLRGFSVYSALRYFLKLRSLVSVSRRVY